MEEQEETNAEAAAGVGPKLQRYWFARENWLVAHMERTARLASRIGERLGFTDTAGLELGGWLHDLGKLLLPRPLLDKRDALTPAELRKVRAHPEIGYRMAKRIPGVGTTALMVVRYHHERLDGSGYPFGLKGRAIPWAARIFAVADVWDALVSPRPYKPAWSLEDARLEMLDYAGRILDGDAVEVLLFELDQATVLASIEQSSNL